MLANKMTARGTWFEATVVNFLKTWSVKLLVRCMLSVHAFGFECVW
jgi:hypothetical protein